MLNSLRATTPRAMFFLAIYTLLAKVLIAIILLFFAPDVTYSDRIPIGLNSALSFLIAFSCILIQTVWLVNILNRIPFLEERTYYVPAIFIVLTSVSTDMNVVSLPLLLNFINIAMLGQLVRLSFNESAKSESFLIGFLTGLWVIFEPTAILLFPFLVVSIYLLKPFRIKEFLLLVIGAFLPVYFSSGISYVFDISLPVSFNVDLIGLYQPTFTFLSLFPILVVLLFSAFTILNYRKNFSSLSTFQKRLSNALTMIFVGTMVVIGFSLYIDWSVICYLMPISAIFIAIYLLRISNKITAEIIHAIFVLVILFSQILKMF